MVGIMKYIPYIVALVAVVVVFAAIVDYDQRIVPKRQQAEQERFTTLCEYMNVNDVTGCMEIMQDQFGVAPHRVPFIGRVVCIGFGIPFILLASWVLTWSVLWELGIDID